MIQKTYKTFLSHNTRDKDQIEGIAQWLEKNGIEVWFDKWDVAPGTRWVQELEKGLHDCSTFLIFFGACGMGPWQTAEGEIAIRHAIEKNIPVIPVLLPDYNGSDALPEFLKLYQTIDMRDVDSDAAFALLLWGITGRNPYRDGKTGLVIPAPEYEPDIIKQYAAALGSRYRNVDLLGIPDLKDKRAIPLQSIFVDLECTEYLSGENDPRAVNEILEQHSKLIVLGDPGAGKSTLLKFLTLQAANQITADKIRQIPMHIVLRNYARWRTEPGRKEVSLLDYYYWHCNGDLNLRLSPGFFERLLQRGLCTVYFDGYDELAGNVMRDDIRKVIEVFAQVKYSRNCYLLSSRIAGYERVPLDKKLFTHIKLAPFSDTAVKSFIRKWYSWKAGELGLSDRERDEKIADLQQKLKEREQVNLLARNPLLLSMIAIIHRNEARLPEERFRLYEKITEALLETWEQTKTAGNIEISLDRLRIRLAYLAQWMHTLSEGKKQRQAEVEKGEIRQKLVEIIQQTEPTRFREDKFAARDEAKRFMEFVNLRAGLLIESGDGIYRFLHLSFQEYFAAYYYNEQDLGSGIWEELYLTHDGTWGQAEDSELYIKKVQGTVLGVVRDRTGYN